ncbi:MAG: FHA domain-containing protein [Proteobacteria bacterium]|nr:FHA domain-containing protein [Pseudomonadota bacterium]
MTALVCAWATSAIADEPDTTSSYRAVVDRVDLEPAAITGLRLRVYLSALSIDGHLLDLTDPKSIRLMIGNTEKKVPYALGTYHEVHDETAIVFVIENAQAYAEVLPTVIETLDSKLIDTLRDQGTQIAVMPYGDTTGTGKLATIKVGKQKLAAIASDGSPGDPALLDTVERALSVLKRAKSEAETETSKGRPLRKMIIIVGDGRDRANDRDRVTRIGRKAAKDGVRIHVLAFAPTDVRRPLLALGELAKQSLGTFRWVRGAKPDSWGPVVSLLAEEINRQNVITFFLGLDDDVSGKKLKIVTVGRTEATSNELKIPDAGCGGNPCDGYCAAEQCMIPAAPQGRGIFGWLLLLGGIGIGGIVVLGVAGAIITKRSPSIAPPGAPPGASGAMPQPPGAIPPPPKTKPSKVPKSKPPKDAPVAPALPQTTAVLFVLGGPRAGERIPLRHGFSIGKAPGSDLVIDDGFASTHHAQIGVDATGACHLYDRGSTNGTLCNGVRVTEYALKDGVIIQIGNTQLRFLAQ